MMSPAPPQLAQVSAGDVGMQCGIFLRGQGCVSRSDVPLRGVLGNLTPTRAVTDGPG